SSESKQGSRGKSRLPMPHDRSDSLAFSCDDRLALLVESTTDEPGPDKVTRLVKRAQNLRAALHDYLGANAPEVRPLLALARARTTRPLWHHCAGLRAKNRSSPKSLRIQGEAAFMSWNFFAIVAIRGGRPFANPTGWFAMTASWYLSSSSTSNWSEESGSSGE